MNMPVHGRRPKLRVLETSDVERELERLVAEAGSYESLAHKADTESLSPEERASLRRMENLRFLMKRSA